MNIAYLKLLEAKLRTVAQEEFDMRTWCGSEWHPWGGKEDLSCGTVACALGHATTIPEFKKLGLRLVRRLANHWAGWIELDQGIKGTSHGFSAGAELFGLSINQSEWLFSAVSYDAAVVSPAMVADRIIELIDHGSC